MESGSSEERLAEAVRNARGDLAHLVEELKRVLAESAARGAGTQDGAGPAVGQTGANPVVAAGAEPAPLGHELPLKMERLRNSVHAAVSAKEDVERRGRAERMKQWNDEDLLRRLERLKAENVELDAHLRDVMMELNRVHSEVAIMRTCRTDL
ncbi:hypothetical protein FVE85_9799 [Porphyridium purpureum]|uniref:Uncharacterized protein n=1 Tax=Porphyridium purpureum TaxID=35688 RepID=A0A5J4YK80_PORPP|nr:hypothetical protein FVE85_7843 [Porphyridium purpureum]KAA8490907.1 hypothetical protein FVE85_9799 [Porphyridium purpureum]|eukprot:POR4296..scf289_17